MRKFGLIGYPLSHSFSQKYFSEKFRRENLSDCVYENFPIKSIYDLKEIIRQNPDLEGLNVTIPYKQVVVPQLDHHSPATLPIQACNCIKIKGGETTAYNTDIVGFEKSLLKKLKPSQRRALILGNGGATEAVRFVLKKLDIQFKIVSRSIHNASDLVYEDLTRDLIEKSLLIINTTPLGMFPNPDQFPLIPYECIGPEHFLFDLIYNPAKTLFLQKGEERGATIQNGADMLVIQAEESWNIWNDPSK